MYDSIFYDIIRSGCQSSAAAVVPYVYSQIQPTRVVDVGCGEGWWGKAFADLGCNVLGLDGEYVENRQIPFTATDISQPFTFPGDEILFDLAICLEVAEHLPESRADGFVKDLCQLAPVILFSAAIPRQSGLGHINCQWPEYWAEKFAHNGFMMNGSIRDRFWDDADVEPWYRQNLMVVARYPDDYLDLFQPEVSLMRIHPIIQSWWK